MGINFSHIFLLVGASCKICGTKYYGISAFKKAQLCADLGKPTFEYAVGSTVIHRAFEWKVLSRRYVRKGGRHSKFYSLEITRSLTPKSWRDKIGPVGMKRNMVHENRLSPL